MFLRVNVFTPACMISGWLAGGACWRGNRRIDRRAPWSCCRLLSMNNVRRLVISDRGVESAGEDSDRGLSCLSPKCYYYPRRGDSVPRRGACRKSTAADGEASDEWDAAGLG